MDKIRRMLATVAVLLSVGPVSAQHEWVGEVFLGWGDGNLQVRSMAVFDGELYTGTLKADGANIYVRGVTPPWVPSATDGFGSASNQHAPAMAVFESFLGTWVTKLYVGVVNHVQGGQVWAYDGVNPWSQANTSGFGDPSNGGVTALATFDDLLYAGTFNASGAEIHSFTGVTWVPQSTGGFGNANNFSISELVVHKRKLWAGTLNNVDGGEIWWSSNGADWYNLVPPGFFNSQVGVSSMASAGGALYAAVHSSAGVQVWRVDPLPIEQVNSNGFGVPANIDAHDMAEYGGELYVGTVNDVSGGQVWRLRGTHWSQVSVSGFGNINNRSIRSLGVYNNELYAGTWNNTDGCEVWRYPMMFADGFESGATIGWSATVP